jgi:2-phospho-L-lactate guanylyltransferase (CobY/MobA/RfbA family)
MATNLTLDLQALFERDETAWLEEMARLIHEKNRDELDYTNLGEYLADMARRDRREVMSRLVILLQHLLKWSHQPELRTGSWRATILHQQDELKDLLESRTLIVFAEEGLDRAFERAVKQAAAEMGILASELPQIRPRTLEQLLTTEMDNL